MTNKPTALLELLSNIKFAIDNHLLLQEGFYTEENLKDLSGGQELNWVRPSESELCIEITNFGAIVNSREIAGQTYSGLEYVIGRAVLKDGAVRARVSVMVTVSDPLASFENIESIFGSNWKPHPYAPLPHGRVFDPPTAPHGNDRIKYAWADATISHAITLEFHADGTLYDGLFEEEMR